MKSTIKTDRCSGWLCMEQGVAGNIIRAEFVFVDFLLRLYVGSAIRSLAFFCYMYLSVSGWARLAGKISVDCIKMFASI